MMIQTEAGSWNGTQRFMLSVLERSSKCCRPSRRGSIPVFGSRLPDPVRDHPYDAEAGGRLFDLASAVGRYLDTPPGAEELKERSTKVAELVQEMLGDLGIEDGKSLPSIVENVVVDTPYTEKAAGRLKVLLGKVGGSTYEIAVKLLSEIATAAAKKILGL